MNIKNLLKLDPFDVNKKTKEIVFKQQINSLTSHHYKNCKKVRFEDTYMNFFQ